MIKEGENRVSFVKWFSELSNKDIKIAGGKGASLAEMYNAKFPIPPGFIVTAQSYIYFIEKSGLKERISEILSSFDVEDTAALEENAEKIRDLISKADIPKEMADEIIESYDILDVNKESLQMASTSALKILKTSKEPPFVAVRSSATAEDLADASFAGQQESFLNVKGHKELIQKVKECFASLFTARAVYYRTKKGFRHEDTHLAAVVQKMIDSDKSGVIFSRNPVKADENILMEAVWGLGEGIVSGQIKPDSYLVDKDLSNFKILEKSVSEKKIAFVRDSSGKNAVIKLTPERGNQEVLNNYEIKTLAQYARKLEEHYKKPQDIEFAISRGEIYIVQSRPITTLEKLKEIKEEVKGELLLSGLGASPGIASGTVKIVYTMADLPKITSGDILVTKMTNPDMVVTMQKAAGIVTDEGGVTSHAAIVSREMGIPAVVGTGNATGTLVDGETITVDGYTGRILLGAGEIKVVEINPIVQTKTKIKVIVDLPNFAERAAKSGAKAVGLTRIEGIIASSGKHPIMFAKENRLEEYIDILYNGLRKIAEPFEEVWIRSSDIRSDEFRNLQGSSKEVEGNPMLGDHGIRFALKHPEILAAEIEAVKRIALDFPDKNIGFMVPQLISLDELKKTKEIAKKISVPKNVKIGIMVETPAAVQIINSLCEEGIDFISFGSNDLTQYLLAIDRNNSEVQYIYDEMNPAVLSALSYVIRRCKKYGVETSICGQAGSRDEMVRFLVSEGIDSISVNADAAERISKLVAELEAQKTLKPEKQMPVEGVKEKMKMNVKQEAKKVESARDKIEEKGMRFAKMEKSIMTQGSADVVDIEEKVLKELEKGEENEKPEENKDIHDEYRPGIDGDKNKDVPALNDAIPIESRLIEERKKQQEGIEFDLEKEINSG